MNFYKHHIGDYAAATAHLSWDEDMAYSRLMRAYYQHEKPIPADKRAAYRLVRAQSKAQREAVDVVLEEFFVLEPTGYRQKRCDEEIAKASEQADTNRRIAEAREAAKRARNVQRTDHEACNESSTVKVVEREPSQTPDSRQEQKISPPPLAAVPSDPAKAAFDAALTILGSPALVAKHMRSAGPDVLRWAVAQTLEHSPVDPKPYLLRLLKPDPNREGKADAYGFVLDAYGRRTGERGVVC